MSQFISESPEQPPYVVRITTGSGTIDVPCNDESEALGIQADAVAEGFGAEIVSGVDEECPAAGRLAAVV